MLWYPQPADENRMLFEGLPLGNGHLGALVSGDPAHDVLHVTVASQWRGTRNSTLLANGQFPYHRDDFGSFTQMAKLVLDLPADAMSRISGYRRELDMAQGCARVSYDCNGSRHQRDVFVSHPDNVLVMRFSQHGSRSCSGRLQLKGAHGETTHAGTGAGRMHFTGQFANGLRHATAVSATSEDGHVSVRHGVLHFDGCRALTIVLARDQLHV